MYRGPLRQNAPQDPVQSANHGFAVHCGGHVPHLHLSADVQQLVENAVCRSPEHPLPRKAADKAGNAGIGQGASLVIHPAQGVTPHGLHHRVAVHAGGKARAHTHHHWCVSDLGAQVLLGQNGVHHRIRLEYGNAAALRVRQHRDDALFQQLRRLLRPLRPAGLHALHFRLPVDHGLGKTHRPPDSGGRRDVRHHHLHPRPPQPQGNPGGDVSRAPNHDQHGTYSPLHKLPATTGLSSSSASARASARVPDESA